MTEGEGDGGTSATEEECFQPAQIPSAGAEDALHTAHQKQDDAGNDAGCCKKIRFTPVRERSREDGIS